jgi:peptidyl-prolyl cis-trans isomerase D
MLLDYMRKNTKRFLYAIVPLIVVSFVFWGTQSDFTGPAEQTLVEIGDTKVSEREFLDYYRMVRQSALQNFGGNISPEIEEMLNLKQQAIDSLIQRTLLEQEMDRLDIVVSNKEAMDAIKRYPDFQTDGKFDPSKWNEAIANPAINWAFFVEQEKQSLRSQKIVEMIQSSARVTDEEVKEKYRQDSEKAKIEFVDLKPAEFMEGTEVSDDEVTAFYEENKEDYAVPGKIVLSYVEIMKEPSQADYDDAEEHCRGILERVQAGDDFAELAGYYSDDVATRENGGDRGFLESRRLEKEYADVAFSMAPGDLSDIVKTKLGFHIIKLDDTKGEGDEKKVRTRHILVKAEPSDYTLTSLGETAVKVAVAAAGSTLEKAAGDNGLTISTTPEFSENTSFIPGLGLVKEAAEILPGLNEGKSSDMIEAEKAYYVIQVDKRIPERIPELSAIEETIKAAAKADKALTLAKTKAEEIVSEINNNGTSIGDIDGIPDLQEAEFSRRGYAPGLPFAGGLANAVFSLSEGKAADPLVSGGSVYVVVLKEKIEADPDDFEEQKDQIRERILSERERQVVEDYLENLRENAGVMINEELFDSA